jgi:hypothetical protein
MTIRLAIYSLKVVRRFRGDKPWIPACAGTIQSLQLDGLEIRRQHDFQHLAIVGIVEHLVPDTRRLEPAASCPHHVRAGTFELGLDPALVYPFVAVR